MAEGRPDWPRLIRRSTRDAVGHLGEAADRDWTVRAGDVRWSCWTTAVHIAEDLFAYAAQVAEQPQHDYLPFELMVPPTTSPAGVASLIGAGGELLAAAVAQAPAHARAYHPWGMTDPSGFAAMGITEVLVHDYDIARGLGLSWPPPDELAEPVVARLFPDAPAWPHADERLLWCTGRIPLTGHPRRSSDWRWNAGIR